MPVQCCYKRIELCMAEVREMTRNAPIFAKSPISASVIPSAKYSCAGSPDRFWSGNTTIEVICDGAVERLSRMNTKRAKASARPRTVSETRHTLPVRR